MGSKSSPSAPVCSHSPDAVPIDSSVHQVRIYQFLYCSSRSLRHWLHFSVFMRSVFAWGRTVCDCRPPPDFSQKLWLSILPKLLVSMVCMVCYTVHWVCCWFQNLMYANLGGTAAAAPSPFRPGNPALCGSHPLVTPYYCRLGDLLCFVFIVSLLYFFC